MKREIAILGAGAAASVFACELARVNAGSRIRIWARRHEAAVALAERVGSACRAVDSLSEALQGAEVSLFCVSDQALREVIALASACEVRGVALHTSGYHDSSLLEALASASGSLHPVRPLPAFTPGKPAERPLFGAHLAFEGSGRARAIAVEWAEALGAVLFDLPAQRGAKHAYHAAAALLSNGTVALYDMALELVGGDEAVARAFLELLASTLSNLERLGVPDALTGPALRGDAEVLAGHIAQLDSEQLALYGPLTRRMLQLALQRKALSKEQVKRLEELF